ncbi:MAG: glycoside hydrolase family 97 catalytic domain-containing protein [Bacteroidales bacterium]|nr:glycoside hydrolase family 97 catalytic domain-containing protein [Bacteroidales bacterium]
MATAGARTYSLSSPDSRIRIEVDTREKVNWSVFYDDILILEPSGISLTLDSFGTLGLNPRIINQESHSVDQGIQSFVPVKSSIIADKYNELVISFRGEYRIAFRAYDNGVAYRFITEIENELIIRSEEINYSFPGNYDVILTHTEGFITHQEALFREMKLSDMADSGLYFPPALVRIKGGPVLLLTEADLFDYPGTYYRKGDGYSLKGVQPGFVLKERQINDRTVIAEERADYIAETTGTRSYPWRVICIAGEEKDLLSNQLVYLLSRPLELENTGWIKPGKVAWDWWNANNISGVDFKSGINTETYLHYIDFAAEYGLEYIILDEGWCHPSDHFRVTPGMDLEAICNYGMEKGVGIILWVVWKTLDNQLEESLAWFEKLGVKGIKVDFMQRDDQWMVNYYLKIARKAAEHNLLVDFHGSYKPSGLRRAYPNVMTREGILGMEHSKWGTDANPDHNVTAPFIRMVAGPMDYTPGAMTMHTPGTSWPGSRGP